MVLSVNNKLVTTFRQVELAVAETASTSASTAGEGGGGKEAGGKAAGSKNEVTLEVLRGGRKQRVTVGTVELGSDETTKVVVVDDGS